MFIDKENLSPKDPARMLPYVGYIPYEPKSNGLTQVEKDKIFRERNFMTFKRPKEYESNHEIENS